MTDERWRLVYAIYEAAAPLGEAERQRYVEAASPDAEIAGRVQAILNEVESAAASDTIPEPAYSIGPAEAPPSSRLPNGFAIGRFVVTGFVGQGGMGRVYSAHDPELDREVALKVIAQQTEASSSEKSVREAQAASALNHPNIVTIYEVIRSGPTVAIAMELVTGTSLRRLCGEAHPVREVAHWGRQIADALAATHSRGIVHRDIKPENLMLRPDGYIKILDFGLAHQDGTGRTDDHPGLGTLGYMAPEQLLQRPSTAASDIFSLGVVLYELASGTHPFRGDPSGATTGLTQLRLPGTLGGGADAPHLPAKELDHLVRTMLSRSAADRPTASEVAVRLEAIAQPRASGRRGLFAAAAVSICVAGGLAVWSGMPLNRSNGKPVLLRSVPLTSEPASETDPAFSPDGGTVTYASDLGSPGIHRIMTRSAAGLASGRAESSQALKLTSAPQDDTNPVWSPDGSRIAFLRRTSAENVQAIVIPSGGGPEQLIANLPGSRRPSARKYLAWAADGEAIVAPHRTDAAFALRLYRFPLSGGAPRLVAEGPDTAQDVSPAFSPDGRWLAFLRWENGATYGLWAVPQPGTNPKLLVTSPFPITTFAWKPDSRTILYGGGAMSTGELWQVDVDGRRALAPFVLEGAPDQITIAPAAGRLAYVLQNLDANIWLLPLNRNRDKDSRSPQKLFASVREEMDPAFSPDGKSIAFASNRSGHWNLWTGNADGSGLRELAAQTLLPFHPAWSPDSRQIAFDAKALGKGEIWVINAAGGSPWRLVAMPGGAEVPSWSRDGNRVLFYTNAEGTRQIWEVAATGGAPVQLTRGGSYDPAESPDGRYLYHGSVSSPGVWRFSLPTRLPDGSLANQKEELIRETLPVTGHRFWTLGQGGLYFVDPQKTPALLKFVDLTSRKVTVMATLPKPPAKFTRGLSISPDGRHALYCEDDVDRYEIRVVETFR